MAERFLGWLRVAEGKGAIRRALITLFSSAGLLPMRRVDGKCARASGLICFSEARTIAIVARGLLLFAIWAFWPRLVHLRLLASVLKTASLSPDNFALFFRENGFTCGQFTVTT